MPATPPRIDAFYDIPLDILEAAEKVARYCDSRGWRDWRIGRVASREFLELVERRAIEAASIARWRDNPDTNGGAFRPDEKDDNGGNYR